MRDYISRDAAKKQMRNGRHSIKWLLESGAKTIGEAFEIVLDEVPAADVRPVVTCGKCKYGKYTGTEWFCDKHSGHAEKFGEDASYHEYHSKHWFCADGEEKNHA